MRSVLLAGAQPRGGLRGADRARGLGDRGEERPRPRHLPGALGLRGGVQADAQTPRGRRRNSGRGVSAPTSQALGYAVSAFLIVLSSSSCPTTPYFAQTKR